MKNGPSALTVAMATTLFWFGLYFAAWLAGYAEGFRRPHPPAQEQGGYIVERRRAALDDAPEHGKGYDADTRQIITDITGG